MAQISDGFKTIEISENNKQQCKIILTADQFHLDALKEYELFLQRDNHYLAGKIIKANEDQLQLCYTIDPEAVSFTSYVKTLDNLNSLKLASRLYWLVEVQTDGLQPFISPQNLYIRGDDVVVMHRGFSNLITPELEDESMRVKQYKALILYLLNPKLDYEKLVIGSAAVNNTFAQELIKLNSLEEVKKLVDKQIKLENERVRQNLISVKKTRYSLMRWTAIITSVAALILLILTIFWGVYTLPKQNHIISAQSNYLNSDYDQVVKDLDQYQAKSLPQSARFVLAVSYINMDDLSKGQKQAVLKNISQKSNANQLNYWIELGRGNYNQALSIAKNIGDNEYILHAYTKLYTATKNNTTMNGGKKQSELNNYRKQINKYIKKLGGSKNEFESN